MMSSIKEWFILKLIKKKSGKFVFLGSFAILMTLLIYLVLLPIVHVIFGDGGQYFIDIFINRGFIPYIIVFCFSMMIGLLLLINFQITFEKNAFLLLKNHFVETSNLPKTLVYTNSLDFIKSCEDDSLSNIDNSIIIRRIKRGMQRLLNTQDTNALIEYFKLRSEIEYAEMDSNFTEIKYFTWLIPTLGFIGTVLGIGIGISGFAGIITHAENFAEVKEHLPSVTRSLGVAFDTTFLALVLSVIGMFTNSSITKKYEKLLEEIDTFCLDDISSRFKLHSTTAEQLKDVFREIKDEITNILQANNIEISNAIHNDLNSIQKTLELLSQKISQNDGKSSNLTGIVFLLQKIEKHLTLLDQEQSIEPKVISDSLNKLLVSC